MEVSPSFGAPHHQAAPHIVGKHTLARNASGGHTHSTFTAAKLRAIRCFHRPTVITQSRLSDFIESYSSQLTTPNNQLPNPVSPSPSSPSPPSLRLRLISLPPPSPSCPHPSSPSFASPSRGKPSERVLYMSDGEDFLYFNSIKNRKQKYLALSDVFAVAEGLRTQVFQRTTKSKGKGKSPIGGSQSTLEARCLSLVTAVRYRPPVYCRQGLIIVGAFVGGHAGLIQHCPKNLSQEPTAGPCLLPCPLFTTYALCYLLRVCRPGAPTLEPRTRPYLSYPPHHPLFVCLPLVAPRILH